MKPDRSSEIGALTLVEQAVGLLRFRSLDLLLPYWFGTLPFVLAALFFWSDVSRHAVSAHQCAAYSMILALLFIWMKTWQSRFGAAVLHRLTGQPLPPWSRRCWIRAAACQSVAQSTGLLLLPAAVALALPLPWVYAYYHNLSVLETGTGRPRIFNRLAWQQASLWPRQNLVVQIIVSGLGLMLFVNLAFAIFFLPLLLKKLLAVETIFSLSGIHVLNSTFLFTTVALTYLCLDPLCKCIFALRCFYGRSQKTGDDLKAELRRLRQRASVAVALLAAALGCLAAPMARPLSAAHPPVEASVTPQQLDRNISEALKDRRFAWRLPQAEGSEPAHETDSGWLATLMEWLGQSIKRAVEVLVDWWQAFKDWLDSLFPKPEIEKPEAAGGGSLPVNLLLYGAIIALALVIAGLLWRYRRRRRPQAEPPPPQPETVVPDLSDEEVTADALPSDRWLELAAEMTRKGRFRLALRAYYLSGLAHLADQQVLLLAPHKSNLDYQRELSRRAAAHRQLQQVFADGVVGFEKAWYGMHPVSTEVLSAFADRQERIRRFARS